MEALSGTLGGASSVSARLPDLVRTADLRKVSFAHGRVRTIMEVGVNVDLELSIRRTRALIDRALDVRNKRRFHELCGLLRSLKAKVVA